MSWAIENEAPKRRSHEELLAAISDERREEALSLLKSPFLIEWIVEGIELCGVAGECSMSLLVYLAATSRLLPRPLAIILQGPSSSGKSFVLEKVASLFPPEFVLTATDITDNALYYLAKGELSHRFILAGERPRGHKEETGQGTKALREMISSGRLSKVVTINTPDGPETKIIDQPGPIAYAESTTANQIFEEDANRCLVLPSDDRPDQTRRILLAHGRRIAGHCSEGDEQTRRELFHAIHLLLMPVPIVIPFAETLAELFPCERVEARRAFGHLISMIHSLVLLHQHQRSRDEQGRVMALPADYVVARQLLEPILARSLGSRAPDALRHFVESLQPHSGEFTAKQLARHLSYSDRTIRENLQALTERGMIEQTQAARGPIPGKWMIRTPFQLSDGEKSILPDVSEVCGTDESEPCLLEKLSEQAPANLSDAPF